MAISQQLVHHGGMQRVSISQQLVHHGGIQMLLDKPSFAPKFDAVYGEGASEEYLQQDEEA